MALQWTSTLSVGVPEIDAQHQELFRRIDRLLDAVLRRDRSEAGAVLAWLGTFVQDHFSAEERLMAETGYPDAERHVKEHRDFARRLAEIEADFEAHGATAAVMYALEQHAVGWLGDHVYFSDVSLGRWVLAPRASATPRAAC
ncbi:MAG: bacteriohemerythrin [Anaeromyxobacteraceae bacterium]|nr:bacteriohemerythrin [Anaeromyxobacteraceae bacterium]